MNTEVEKVIEQPTIPPAIPLGNGRLIYIAGPYRAKTDYEKAENIWHAIKASIRLWQLGWFCFCPHANTAHFDVYSSLPPEVYLKGGLAFLEKCDAIFMLKGWEGSIGAKLELELAVELNKEVYYEKDS